MPFFSKSISQLHERDLQELLDANATENIRLEFKREVPGPDELLKKLSGFANTFGGYLVVGAEASSSDGRIVALPGVAVQPSYRQTVVQRCNDGTWPPVSVSVSDPIPASGSSNVCYVVHVPQSMQAPHFLTKRRGVYVRTDEFSQRYDARLANFDEITHLAARRGLAVEQREALYRRSTDRFQHFVASDYTSDAMTSGEIGATMVLSLSPEFPTARVTSIPELTRLLRQSHIKWRQVGFPRLDKLVTQHESVIALYADGNFSMFEANVWGCLFHASEIEHVVENDPQRRTAIHLWSLLGHILAYLEHAKGFFAALGGPGQLLLRMRLVRVRGVSFVNYPSGNQPNFGPASPLDDEVSFDTVVNCERIATERDAVAGELLQSVFFALNWPDHATEAASQTALVNATRYNFW